MTVGKGAQIDRGAVVLKGSDIGPDAHLAGQAVVDQGSSVGANTEIGKRTYVGQNVTIKDDCSIGGQNYIGQGQITQPEKGARGEYAKVTIGQKTTLADHCSVDQGALVGSGSRLERGSQIHAGATVGQLTTLGVNARVEAGARLGTYVQVPANHRVREGAVVANNRELIKHTTEQSVARAAPRPRQQTTSVPKRNQPTFTDAREISIAGRGVRPAEDKQPAARTAKPAAERKQPAAPPKRQTTEPTGLVARARKIGSNVMSLLKGNPPQVKGLPHGRLRPQIDATRTTPAVRATRIVAPYKDTTHAAPEGQRKNPGLSPAAAQQSRARTGDTATRGSSAGSPGTPDHPAGQALGRTGPDIGPVDGTPARNRKTAAALPPHPTRPDRP